mgnify:CR=1 FL=1
MHWIAARSTIGIDAGFNEIQHIVHIDGVTGSRPVQTGTNIALSATHFPVVRGGRIGRFFRLLMGGSETEISCV